MHISQGSGGCCDCGDPEAWRLPMTCKIHCSGETPTHNQPFPDDLLESIRKTISTVLEMIIDIFNQIPENPRGPIDAELLKIPNILDQDNPNEIKYGLVLWNDEHHSFNEVIEELMGALRCTEERASDITRLIDKQGREVIKVAESLSALSSLARRIEQKGLNLSLVKAKDAYRQSICGYLLEWLKELPENVIGNQIFKDIPMESAQNQVRQIICQEMMRPVLYHEMNTDLSSRAKSLLLFGKKIWKHPRICLKQLFIKTMIVHGDDTKKWFAMVYARHYLKITQDMLTDSEEYETKISALAVQLFTVPSIATGLVRNSDIVVDILGILKAYYLQDNYSGQVNLSHFFDESVSFAKNLRLSRYKPFECSRTFLQKYKPFHLINDLNYLISSLIPTGGSADIFSVRQGDETNLSTFLDFLTVMQGMQLQKRALLTHVEFEFEGWAHTFHISRTLMRTLKMVGECYHTPDSHETLSRLLFFISETMDSLYSWTIEDHFEAITKHYSPQSTFLLSATGFHVVEAVPGFGYRVPDFKVEFLPISIHHPLHWLLSSLLIQLPRVLKYVSNPTITSHIHQEIFSVDTSQVPNEMKKNGDLITLPELLEHLCSSDRQLLIFDYPLQVCAFVAQVKAGIWVRNGRSVRLQADYFRDILLSDCYNLNLFLLQFSTLKFGGDLFLNCAMDRYSVLEWFRTEQVETRFDGTQMQALVHDFLHLIIILLSDRAYLAGYSNTQIVRKEMIHQLACCSSGLSFSALSKRMEAMTYDIESHSQDEDYESFEVILNTIANFKFPEGIADHGVYTLKDEYYEQVNPWYWHYTRNQREELEEILRKRFKGHSDMERILYIPKMESLHIGSGLEKIGEMVHARTFVYATLVGLWKSIRPVIENPGSNVLNDSIWSALIFLLLTAVHIAKSESQYHSNPNFFEYCESLKIEAVISWDNSPRSTSLLDLLLCVIDRASEPDFKEHAPKFRYIVRQFEELGNSRIQTIIRNWRDKSDWNFFNQPQKSTEEDIHGWSEKERKKRAAKARQANIMAQFAQAQNSFMANYGDEMEDIEDEFDEEQSKLHDTEMYSDERACPFPEGVCIVCQEETRAGGRLFGMLTMLDRNTLKKQVDFSDGSSINGVHLCSETLDTPIERPNIDINKLMESHFPDFQEQVDEFKTHLQNAQRSSQLKKPSICATTCGHLMHMDCFRSYMRSIQARHNSQPLRNHPENLSKKEFLCPLCKSLGNAIFPIVWSSKKEFVNWNGSDGNSFNDEDVMAYFITEVSPYLTDMIHKRAKKTSTEHVIEVSPASLPGAFPTDEESGNLIKEMVSQNMAIVSVSDLYVMAHYSENYDQIVYSKLVKLENEYKDETLIPAEFNMSPLVHLWKLIYSTIVNLEIQSRGVTPLRYSVVHPKQLSIGIFDCVGESSLKLLRVLCETSLTTLYLSAQKFSDSLQQYSIDFLKSFLPDSSRKTGPKMHTPLLLRDGFKHLVYFLMSTFTQIQDQGPDQALMWVRVLGFFEIVRSIVGFIEALLIKPQSPIPKSDMFKADPKKFESICKLFWLISESLGVRIRLSPDQIPFMYKLVKTNYHIYLRKSVVLLYGRCGLVPPSGSLGFADPKRGNYNGSDEEVHRLCLYLNVPIFEEFLNSVQDPFYTAMISHWCENLKDHESAHWSHLGSIPGVLPRITIDQPELYELVQLPKRLEVLFEVAFHTRCTNCNTIPVDPSICLFCGKFVCTQSYCCGTDSQGECNLHMKEYCFVTRCGSAVGAYFNVKRCSVLLLREGGSGIFMNPPYLDIHGEVDPGLNRGKPQFLNQKRYDEVRKLWLTNTIPSHIARKLEEIIDNGGWVTL